MKANVLDRPGPSIAEEHAALWTAGLEDEFEALLAEIDEDSLKALEHDWQYWGRPAQQIPPGDWFVWLIMSGRGFGKTRTGAETVHEWTNQVPLIAICAEDASDVRDTLVEGESGILACAKPDNRPEYEPSKRRLTWPNGCRGTTYGLGSDPDQIRGPQFHKAWCDEIAKWQYADDAWSNLELAIRLGTNPQIVGTTTPRPIKLIRDLLKDDETVVTHGTSYENIGNLSPKFIRRVIRRYEGTRLGRQELHAELLEDVPGALWKRSLIQYRRHADLERIVVSVDPAATAGAESAETGIIVCGRAPNGTGWILGDHTGRMSPLAWGKRAVMAYTEWQADRVVYEANQGGDMVAEVIRQAAAALGVPTPAMKAVHATRGKRLRAEPVAAAYERLEVFHALPFESLEDQMCTWLPDDDSPDRLDAAVHGLTELLLDQPEPMDDEDIALMRGMKVHN